MTARAATCESLVRSGPAGSRLGRVVAAAPVLGWPAVPALPQAASLADVIRAGVRANEARARQNQAFGVMP